MLVDINAYVGHWPFRQMNFNTCETLLDRMNKSGVDVSVISNLDGIFYQNTQPANEKLHGEMNSSEIFRDRLVPFAVINPIYAGWKEDLLKCSDQFGMKGIRLYPKYHGYDLTNPSCIELVKMARDRNLPVAFSLRMADSRPSSWLDLGGETEWNLKDIVSIVREVPNAKYLILNVANSTRMNDDETDLLKKTDLIMDTSGRSMNNLPNLLSIFGKEKFAFGTHSPILDYYTGRLRIEALKDTEADKETKALFRAGNAKAFLEI